MILTIFIFCTAVYLVLVAVVFLWVLIVEGLESAVEFLLFVIDKHHYTILGSKLSGPTPPQFVGRCLLAFYFSMLLICYSYYVLKQYGITEAINAI